MIMQVPEILNIPSKLTPMIYDFNKYRYLLAEGGRAGGKTQSVGRFVLFLGEQRKIKIVCGRETQATIEDSVYSLLVDLIKKYNLNYSIKKTAIVNNKTGSKIIFKGFREYGAVNIKGLEGIDLLWIDEAESITQQTLDIIIPTIRKPNSRIFFTMNRRLPKDPVYSYCASNDKCLHIKINYYDNPFVSKEIIDEARRCKEDNEDIYNNVWLGEPLDVSSDRLFRAHDISRMSEIEPFGDDYIKARVIGIDFAAQGGDKCVATILDRCSATQWRCVNQIAWSETDPMSSIGRIVQIIGEYKPDMSLLDVGGMGYVVYSRLRELNVDINKFDGASRENVPIEYGNMRAYGYYTLAEYLRDGRIIMKSNETEAELIDIRYKYASDGKRFIQSKADMKKAGIHSPDRADSLMMAVVATKKVNKQNSYFSNTITRKNNSKWR